MPMRKLTSILIWVGQQATGSDNSREGIGAKGSFASLLKKPMTSKAVRLSMMKNTESVTGANVAIPLPDVEEVSKRFENTLYGYFIGKRLAFPFVGNFVKNAWEKFGLERAMLSNGFFFFQFSSQDGMERVLKNRPWALVEVSSLNPLQDLLVVAIPFPDGSRHSMESIEVEYEWTPPKCETRKIFDHVDDACPKRVTVVVQSQVEDDGFIKVNNRKNKKKQQSTNQQGSNRQVAGMKLSKLKLNLVYKVVNKHVTDEDGPPIKKVYGSTDVDNLLSDDEEDIENMYDETILNASAKNVSKGASTPSQEGSRIIMGWNPDILNVVVIAFDDQIMHTYVLFKADKKLICGGIYFSTVITIIIFLVLVLLIIVVFLFVLLFQLSTELH
nr:zinc knuckle CX2CX4HX4C [Tanacetum cinerariifolium]